MSHIVLDYNFSLWLYKIKYMYTDGHIPNEIYSAVILLVLMGHFRIANIDKNRWISYSLLHLSKLKGNKYIHNRHTSPQFTNDKFDPLLNKHFTLLVHVKCADEVQRKWFTLFVLHWMNCVSIIRKQRDTHRYEHESEWNGKEKDNIFICMVFKVAFQYFCFDAIETTVTNGTILSYEISIAIGKAPIANPGKHAFFTYNSISATNLRIKLWRIVFFVSSSNSGTSFFSYPKQTNM